MAEPVGNLAPNTVFSLAGREYRVIWQHPGVTEVAPVVGGDPDAVRALRRSTVVETTDPARDVDAS
jgi:hypothetical protein